SCSSSGGNRILIIPLQFRAYFVSGGAPSGSQSVDSLTSLFASAVAAVVDATVWKSRVTSWPRPCSASTIFDYAKSRSNSVIIERVLDDKASNGLIIFAISNESGLFGAVHRAGLRLADLPRFGRDGHWPPELSDAPSCYGQAVAAAATPAPCSTSLIGRVVGDRPGNIVSRIPDLFPALAQQLEQARQSADRTAPRAQLIFLRRRCSHGRPGQRPAVLSALDDRLGGEGRVKQQQQQQQSRWLDYDRSGQWLHGIANQLIGHLGQSVSEARVRAELLSDTADCLDLVLASLSGGDQFEATRALFALWEKCDAPDRAVALAERYREFDLLIRVCESLPDSQEQQQMLSRYQAQLSGFSTHLAAYYLRTGKRGCLLRMTALQQQNQQSQQQQHHHPETQPLAWLQEVASGQFGRAGATLSALARSEKRLASRKRSLLSMAKLAYWLAAAEPLKHATGNIEANSSKRSKPGNQQHRRQRYTRVYTAAELIDKFTSHAANSFADQSELEFKRALDLLAYLTESDDREALRALVWARALLTDWTRTQQESQQQHGGDASVSMTGDIMAGSVFIRTAELLCSDLIDGRELNLARPPTVNQLLQCPAVPPELRSNPQFEYHVKVLHERAAPLLVP
uniref:Nucleoporin_C domain-containing protein n=1 Tax=Macrostomum lignano TaxID=282301 RepID=A0A1I8FNG5_9PLAT